MRDAYMAGVRIPDVLLLTGHVDISPPYWVGGKPRGKC
jgi:hypothetical protein